MHSFACALTSLSVFSDSPSPFSCFVLVPVSVYVMIHALFVTVVCVGEVVPWLQAQELPKQRRPVCVPGHHTQRVSLLTL